MLLRKVSIAILILSMMLSVQIAARGQGNTSSLFGVTTDEQRSVLPNFLLKLQDTQGSPKRALTSGSDVTTE